MIPELTERDLERFRALVARHLGLACDDSRRSNLLESLAARVRETRAPDAGSYLDGLEDGAAGEIAALGGLLTVGETYFLRIAGHFQALAEVALPERARARGSVRILSAGCATGEEPYSIAMTARDAGFAHAVSIDAIDVNALALERAAAGRYPPWSFRETPDAAQSRWFRLDGRERVIDPELRTMVHFQERNLAAPDAAFFAPAAYDVIFCRNVLMYFTPESLRAVVARLATALAPGGYLFLGHAETLRGISSGFHLCHTHESFYYRRRAGRVPPPESPAPSLPPALAAPIDTSWIDAIGRSSERVEELAVQARSAPRIAPADIEQARALYAEDRFADALSALGAPPASGARDADASVLRAAVLTNQGRLAEAEAECAALLRDDELHAGAHHLMAVCREHAGDPAGAAGHWQMAAYLDPTFAMPHLHLGRLAERDGDGELARRELVLALELFATDEAGHILLFGGGFSRSALVAFCRAALARLGGGA